VGLSISAGVEEMAQARCDREVRCGGVGPDQAYETHDGCMARLTRDGSADFEVSRCRDGFERLELEKCLSEIHLERCDAPLDTLERLTVCRPTTLCKP
jgi:hypothetical protein